jgi:hypothetical protein
METCLVNVLPDIREIRVRADASFGFNPVIKSLEVRPTQYAVVARLTQVFKRLLPGSRHESANRYWTNMALVKDSKVTERASVQFRAEAFNAFNNVHFSLPINVLTGAAFGLITSTGSPHTLQSALKLLF